MKTYTFKELKKIFANCKDQYENIKTWNYVKENPNAYTYSQAWELFQIATKQYQSLPRKAK